MTAVIARSFLLPWNGIKLILKFMCLGVACSRALPRPKPVHTSVAHRNFLFIRSCGVMLHSNQLLIHVSYARCWFDPIRLDRN